MLIWVRPSKIKKDSFLLFGHLNNIAADKMLLPNMKGALIESRVAEETGTDSASNTIAENKEILFFISDPLRINS